VLCPCDDPYESNFFKYFALHFNDCKLKKLVATCYAGSPIADKELSLFPNESTENKTTRRPHKIELTDNDGAKNLDDVKSLLAGDRHHLTRLRGDGDFRSDEVKKLRDEADIIVTNPPFSLFREFLGWVTVAGKQFLIIANMNAITYKEVFPLIKENKLWTGNGFDKGNAFFSTPVAKEYADGVYDPNTGLVKFRNCCWFTNLDHGRRHKPLLLLTMKEQFKYSRHKEVSGKKEYDRYDNYDAIEVPFTDAIPGDYDGVMGVPVSFLDKYCPEQFEILGMCENLDLYGLKTKTYTTEECRQAYFAKFGKKGTYDLNASGVVVRDGLLEKIYQRILIKRRGT
jgi:hypothetical protein